jgi:predicted PurR-regulated permease PerM
MPKYDPQSGKDPERYEPDYDFQRDEYRLYGRYVVCTRCLPQALQLPVPGPSGLFSGPLLTPSGCSVRVLVRAANLRPSCGRVSAPAAWPRLARAAAAAAAVAAAAPGSQWRCVLPHLAVQSALNVLAAIICFAAFVVLKFMLCPLTLAYFVTFLQAPILDLFEKRPIACGTIATEETKDLPEAEQEMEEKLICNNVLDAKRIALPRDERGNGSLKGMAIDCLLLGKSPHMLAVLFTMIASVAILGLIGLMISTSLAGFAEQQQELVDAGAQPMGEALAQMGNDYMVKLEEMGVDIYQGEYCTFRNNSNYKMIFDEQDEAPRYKSARDPETMMDTHKNSDLIATVNILNVWNYEATPKPNCTLMDVFWMPNDDGIPMGYDMSNYPRATGSDYRGEGQTYGELMGTVGVVSGLVEQITLVLLLSIYIIVERPEGRTVSGDHAIMEEVEDLIKNYINLKTAISALTGVLVAIFLLIGNCPLALVWGLLSFLLNFIPNVGSAAAIVLPLPIIILADEQTMSGTQKMIAILGPTAVQGYVGNALEPTLFGAALNLTAISILLGLVLFSAVWGLSGAVLSVPFLGIMKIIAHHTDHPQAKIFLATVREDAEVDVEKDIAWAKLREQRAKREAKLAQAMLDAEAKLGLGAGYADRDDKKMMEGDMPEDDSGEAQD